MPGPRGDRPALKARGLLPPAFRRADAQRPRRAQTPDWRSIRTSPLSGAIAARGFAVVRPLPQPEGQVAAHHEAVDGELVVTQELQDLPARRPQDRAQVDLDQRPASGSLVVPASPDEVSPAEALLVEAPSEDAPSADVLAGSLSASGLSAVSSSEGSSSAGLSQSALMVSSDLEEPTSQIEQLAADFIGQLERIDPGISYLIGRIEEEPDLRCEDDARQLIESIEQLARAAEKGLGQVGMLADSVGDLGQISNRLRPVSRRMSTALRQISNSSRTIQEWNRRLYP